MARLICDETAAKEQAVLDAAIEWAEARQAVITIAEEGTPGKADWTRIGKAECELRDRVSDLRDAKPRELVYITLGQGAI